MAHPSCILLVPFLGLSQPAPSLVNSMKSEFETYHVDSPGSCQAVQSYSLEGSGLRLEHDLWQWIW